MSARPQLTHLLSLTLALGGLLSANANGQTIALVSDLNGRYGSTEYNARVSRAVEDIIAARPSVVVSAGDMVAGQQQPRLDRDRLEAMWRGFFSTFADPLMDAGIPLWVVPGNHDASAYPQFRLERDTYRAEWSARAPGASLIDGSDWPLRFATWLDDILVVGFDATMPGAVAAEEFEFVRRTLEANARQARFVLVVSHLPFWPVSRGREREILRDEAFLDLLHRHDVDAYASGHHHLFYAGYDDRGMLHVSIGALGGNVRRYARGDPANQTFSWVLLETSGGCAQVAAHQPTADRAVINAAKLPASISGPAGTLNRWDLGCPGAMKADEG